MKKTIVKATQWAMALGAVTLLVACSSDPLSPARVVDRSSYSSGARQGTPVATGALRDSGKTHTIALGDTIYNISYRYGLDQYQLMKLNNITDPTQLKLGDVLRLPVPVKEGRSLETNSNIRIQTSTIKSGQSNTRANTVKTVKVSEDEVKTAPIAKPEELSDSKPLKPLPPVVAGTRLLWPAKGKVEVADGDVKAINIKGVRGDIVVAAMDGDALFTGAGVKGYGNLVILRHSPTLVTAYAHLDKVTVKRGARVRAGQKIGEMGSTDAKEPMLRFEVREKGMPTDPMRFLNVSQMPK